MIYFVYNKNHDAIKIGFSESPYERIKEIQRNCLDQLKMIGTMPGDRNDEKSLHARFSEIRIRFEWFQNTPELMEFINNNTTNNPPPPRERHRQESWGPLPADSKYNKPPKVHENHEHR